EAEGHVEHEPRPLYLPRHSIRAIIVLAFVGLAVYLYREDRLFQSQPLLVLGAVSAYFFGVIARGLRKWLIKDKPSITLRNWGDLKAIVVLSVLAYVAAAYLFDRPDLAPAPVRNTALGLVLFYFGSR